MTGRELTTRTYVGEVKCAPMGKTSNWLCGTLISNDASAAPAATTIFARLTVLWPVVTGWQFRSRLD